MENAMNTLRALFARITPEQLSAQKIAESRIKRIEHIDASEFSKHMSAYHEGRIKRLEAEQLDTSTNIH